MGLGDVHLGETVGPEDGTVVHTETGHAGRLYSDTGAGSWRGISTGDLRPLQRPGAGPRAEQV